MTVNHLASNYKTFLALPFICFLFAIATGYVPLAHGVDTTATMAMLLVPILALIASDHLDTYQLFKSGVFKLAAIDFKDDRVDKVLDAAVQGFELYEKYNQKEAATGTAKTYKAMTLSDFAQMTAPAGSAVAPPDAQAVAPFVHRGTIDELNPYGTVTVKATSAELPATPYLEDHPDAAG